MSHGVARVPALAVALAFAVLFALAVAEPVMATLVYSPPTDDNVLVVDADGGEYTSIQQAVDDATAGDTVRVLPGTYRESVTLTRTITVSAPRGATLNGTGQADVDAAIEIEDDAAPVVQGFTVTGYSMGVKAYSTTGNWVVRNTTFRGLGRGVGTIYSTGDWRVQDVTIRNVSGGIDAVNSEGDWTVEDTVIRNVTEGKGVEAVGTTGDWTIRNVTIADVDFVAIAASYSHGDWRLVNSTLTDTLVGVGAIDASGDWLVQGSTFTNASTTGNHAFWQPPLTEGVAIDARGTNGSWTVRHTRFTEIDVAAIHAPGAALEGDATDNWFEPSNDSAICVGAVNCGDRLSTWPPSTSMPTPSPKSLRSPTPFDTLPSPVSPAPESTTSVAGPSKSDPGASSTPEPTSTTAPVLMSVVLLAVLLAGLVAGAAVGRRGQP